MAKQQGTLEVHEHSYVSGDLRGARYRNGAWTEGHFSHSHEGGSVPHLHPDTGPAHYTGRWPKDRRKFTVKPTGPQLEYIERPPEERTFRVVFVDEYTDGHASAGISRERWERERAAFIELMENDGTEVEYASVSAERRMVNEFGLIPIYELSKPEEGEKGATLCSATNDQPHQVSPTATSTPRPSA